MSAKEHPTRYFQLPAKDREAWSESLRFMSSGNAAFAAVVADFDGQGVPAGFDQTGRYGVMTLYVVACATGDLFSVPIHNVFIVYSARVQL